MELWHLMPSASSTVPDQPIERAPPVEPAVAIESDEPPDAAVPAPASAGTPRLVTVVAILIVLLFTPAWVDPTTVLELSGGTRPVPGGLGLPVPDPRTGFAPLSLPVPPAAGPARTVARDTFSRTVSGGWGSADSGTPYNPPAADDAPNLSVDGGHGAISVTKPGDTTAVILEGSPRVTLTFPFRCSRPAAAAGTCTSCPCCV
jgi:hypothetical protein